MIVIIGVLVALVGLVLVGTGGGSVRRGPHNRMPIGLALIVLGAMFALLGGQIMLMMGWAQP